MVNPSAGKAPESSDRVREGRNEAEGLSPEEATPTAAHTQRGPNPPSLLHGETVKAAQGMNQGGS